MVILSAMKRFSALTLAVLAIISLPLSAANVCWYTSTEPYQMMADGSPFSDSGLTGASSVIPLDSIVEIRNKENGRTSIITIRDTMPEMPSGRVLAVTSESASELGMQSSLIDADIRIIQEGINEEKAHDEDTGWYSFDLGSYDAATCFLYYSRLIKNGLKPAITEEEGSLRLEVKYIRKFEIDPVKRKIALAGIQSPEERAERNPIL